MNRLKVLVLGSFAVGVAIASPASAADLPARTAPPLSPVFAQPVFNWTGFYVGVNAGLGWSNGGDATVFTPGGGVVGLSGSGGSGFAGGGQIGYNFQSGALVYGLEADLQYADLNSDSNFAGAGFGFLGLAGGSGGQYFGTVRARVGYAMDRTLLYVTGGLAYGGINSSWFGDESTDNVGWTIGAGVEYALTNNWTVRVEGLYVNLGANDRTVALPGPGGIYTVTGGSGDGGGVARVGLNYKF